MITLFFSKSRKIKGPEWIIQHGPLVVHVARIVLINLSFRSSIDADKTIVISAACRRDVVSEILSKIFEYLNIYLLAIGLLNLSRACLVCLHPRVCRGCCYRISLNDFVTFDVWRS